MNGVRILVGLCLLATLSGCAGYGNFSARGRNWDVNVSGPLGGGYYGGYRSMYPPGPCFPEGCSVHRLEAQAAYNAGRRDGAAAEQGNRARADKPADRTPVVAPAPTAFQSGGMGAANYPAEAYIVDRRTGALRRYSVRPGERFPPLGSRCRQETVTADGNSFETLVCTLPNGQEVLDMKGYQEEEALTEALRGEESTQEQEKAEGNAGGATLTAHRPPSPPDTP